MCVLWIVGVWHMRQYLPLELRPSVTDIPVYKSITMGVLACFTFLSGYFLKKYEFRYFKDALVFYKKRFLRFYPLFVVATFCLIICGSSVRQAFLATVGLSMICNSPPPIQTLWYFSMLLLFYLVTPLLKIRRDNWQMGIVTIILVISFLVASYFFFDKRLFVYFPFYVLGLNISNHAVDRVLNPFTLVVSIVLFLLLCLCETTICFIQIVQSLWCVAAILSFCKIVYFEKMKLPVAFVAEASMCAYLFHRPLYAIIVETLRKTTQYQFMPIPIALISIFVLFILAYFIQSYYNRLIHQVSFKYGR